MCVRTNRWFLLLSRFGHRRRCFIFVVGTAMRNGVGWSPSKELWTLNMPVQVFIIRSSLSEPEALWVRLSLKLANLIFLPSLPPMNLSLPRKSARKSGIRLKLTGSRNSWRVRWTSWKWKRNCWRRRRRINRTCWGRNSWSKTSC